MNDLDKFHAATPLGPRAKGFIPLMVGFTTVDLTPESAKGLIDAMDDWFGDELPLDLVHFRHLLSNLR